MDCFHNVFGNFKDPVYYEMLLKKIFRNSLFVFQRTNKSQTSLKSHEDEKIVFKTKYLTPMGCFQTARMANVKIAPGYWEENHGIM